MSRLSAIIIASILAATGAASAEPAARTVQVTGTAASRALPDIVVWRVQLSDTHVDMVKAKLISDEKAKAVLAIKKDLGAAADDIQLCQVRISRDTDNIGRFTGYTVSRDITLRMTQMADFDRWLKLLTGATEMELSYSLDSSKTDALMDRARRDALAAAKAKAKLSVELLGGKLGAVQTIRIQSTQSPRQHYGASSGGFGGGADVISGTMAPSAIEVRFTVDVSFAIN